MKANRAYPLIVELELWLPPLSDRAPLEGKELAARCQRETGLPSDVVLGVDFVPDEQDVEQIKHAFEMEEVEPAAFQDFCERRGLPPTPDATRSAAEFLVFIRGQSLVWLHLPAEPSGLAMAKTLWRWAHTNNMQVHDGASTYELLSEEQVYGRWQSAA
jgi:hypothetical protein